MRDYQRVVAALRIKAKNSAATEEERTALILKANELETKYQQEIPTSSSYDVKNFSGYRLYVYTYHWINLKGEAKLWGPDVIRYDDLDYIVGEGFINDDEDPGDGTGW